MSELDFARKATKIHCDTPRSTKPEAQLASMAPLIESMDADPNGSSKYPVRGARNTEAAVLKTCRPSPGFITQLSLTAFFTIRFVRFGVFNTVQLAAILLLSLFLLSLPSF
jgi:hypothetical protein